MNSTLYERIGGIVTVEAAVNRFYDRFLAESEIKSFFKGIDMNSQKQKLRKFFAILLGGHDFPINRFIEVHTPIIRRHLQKTHVELWIQMTEETLLELNIPRERVHDFMDTCEPYHKALISLITENSKTKARF